jgi:DNA-directed RNA polymerase specialized sigma24 family protein
VAGLDVDALVAQHGTVLLALAHAITRNWAEAEDLHQSTLEIAVRNADRLREPAAARAWLIRIETREAFRVGRRLRRFVSLDLHVEELQGGCPEFRGIWLRGGSSSPRREQSRFGGPLSRTGGTHAIVARLIRL